MLEYVFQVHLFAVLQFLVLLQENTWADVHNVQLFDTSRCAVVLVDKVFYILYDGYWCGSGFIDNNGSIFLFEEIL